MERYLPSMARKVFKFIPQDYRQTYVELGVLQYGGRNPIY